MIQSILFRGLVDHLWQSTLFVGAAWLLTLALKKNRAQVRYWVWFTASVKFLAPLALLVAVGELAPKHAAGPVARIEWMATVDQIAEPSVALPAVTVSVERTSRNYFVPVALAVWACGFLSVAICWLSRWRRVLAMRRTAIPVSGLEFPVPVMSARGLVEPGVFGVLRPVLLLPERIGERLSPAQLDAILAHELCHVRRRDNLTATIHMLVQAIFWFHPLVWWLGMRLVDERELACDEEVVRRGSKPQVYAEGILNICKLYVESPLACVSGVTGSNLKKRIEAIMRNRNVLGLNFGKKLALAIAGAAAVAVPIAVGILHAQSPAATTPKFEVASIRPCELAPADPGGRGGPPAPTPGRLSVCGTAMSFIMQAYGRFATGHFNPNLKSFGIEGGPAWIKSGYQITAKAEDNASEEMMRGPMMQALLEDRFKLRVHRETRDLPVYALTAAKSGPKLKAFKEGGCIPPDLTKVPPPPPAPGQQFCDYRVGRGKGPSVTVRAQGRSLDDFSTLLGVSLDHPVINKTGITGVFDIYLEFAIDEITPNFLPGGPFDPPGGGAAATTADPAGAAPSIFTAIQEQLGLRLEPAKGLGEFLVIDSVERPSEN